MRVVWAVSCVLALGACGPADGISRETEPFTGITDGEVITSLGTEPFWMIEISGDEAVYSSPDQLDGTSFAISRFAGNNGLGFSGDMDGTNINLTITPGECSDAMSDRVFPFTATLAIGDDTLMGCAYTDLQGFAGESAL